MALASFAGAVFVGLVAGNPAVVILTRALVVMLLAWLVGWLVGKLAVHFVQQAIDAYLTANPLPQPTADHGQGQTESQMENAEELEVIDAVPVTQQDDGRRGGGRQEPAASRAA